MANILVVDDELGIRDLLSEILGDEGHHVELAENAAQARAARARSRPDLLLIHIWVPATHGVTLLKECDAGDAYFDIVARFLGRERPFRFMDAPKKGFLSRLFRG